MEKAVISVDWLKSNLVKENLVILDASPENTVTGNSSPYGNLCIENARIFNIKKNFEDKKSDIPNTTPPPAQFQQECQSLGINVNSEIVVYDNLGIYTSPRVWWLFKIMGHQNVSVLNGGLPAWINKGYKTINKRELKQQYQAGNFKSKFSGEHIIKYKDILENIETEKFLVVDARSKGRFNGTEKEPREYLQSGNIPNSINIPYKTLLKDGKFKSKQELNKIFGEKINNQAELVFSCGSGMTACIVMLASEISFKKSKHLYDGSWTEFAALQNLRNEVK